jgi:hypothetical protein
VSSPELLIYDRAIVIEGRHQSGGWATTYSASSKTGVYLEPALLAALWDYKSVYSEEVRNLSVSLRSLREVGSNLFEGSVEDCGSWPAATVDRCFGWSIARGAVGACSVPEGGNYYVTSGVEWHFGSSCASCAGPITQAQSYPTLYDFPVAQTSLCHKCTSLQGNYVNSDSVVFEIVLEVIGTMEEEFFQLQAFVTALSSACFRLIFLLLGSLVPRGIALRQRPFFLNHGTHPPETAQHSLRLFPGRVFQP